MADKMWFEDEKVLRKKEKSYVVKSYDDDGSFLCSSVVPSVYYPLNGAPEVFHCKNCVPLTNKDALLAFNSVKYRIGECYDNTDALVAAFKREGLTLTPYFGYLWIVGTGSPVFHSFAVYEENGQKSVIDLADDYTNMASVMATAMQGKDGEEARQMFIEYTQQALKQPNSVRCNVVGVPSNDYLYVGAPCTPSEAKKIRDNLLEKYPDHICFQGTDQNGRTKIQQEMQKRGLL